jgi:DNA repair exonuclease SbcCD nuclease subunit
LRFVHTADWQVGKVFRFVDVSTMHLLQEARLEAISTIGRLAIERGAPTVLVGGDVYDKEGLADRTLAQPLERMRAWPTVTWHLMPGNHDPHRPDGLWDRLRRLGLPDNVRIHLTPTPCRLTEQAWLLPAPLERRHGLADPTAWMSRAATPERALRIGLAHGSTKKFGLIDTTVPNLIAPERTEEAGLAYLALGDWHGMKQITPRCWYSGTPEPDDFDIVDGGFALLVEARDPERAPEVTPLETGRYHWRREVASIHGEADIGVLEARLRALSAEPARLVLDLTVEGTLTLAERAIFEQQIAGALGAALAHLRLDDRGLLVTPSADDLDAIAPGGFVRAAAERLKGLAADPGNPEREIAALALMRLYVEHRKAEGP